MNHKHFADAKHRKLASLKAMAPDLLSEELRALIGYAPMHPTEADLEQAASAYARTAVELAETFRKIREKSTAHIQAHPAGRALYLIT